MEGTILLGLDDHTEDDIKRLMDFLLEIDLDLAEFTVLTPFPHTRAYGICTSRTASLTYDWDDYTADKVVFQPRHMSAGKAPGTAGLRLEYLLPGRTPGDKNVQAVAAGDAPGK